MNIARTALLAALIGLSGLAGTAHAGTVSYEGNVLRYTGGAGPEKVAVDLSYDEKELFVTEEDFDFGPAPGCRVDDRGRAVCPLSPDTRVEATLGAGDDRFKVTSWPAIPVTVDAGDGRDDVTGGIAGDTLVGGPGRDRLSALEGDDVIDLRDGASDETGPLCFEGNDVARIDGGGIDGDGIECERIERAAAPAGVVTSGEASLGFKATPGADNKLTVTRAAQGVRVSDPAGVAPGFGCERESYADPTAVVCPTAQSVSSMDLGDGNDSLRVVDVPTANDDEIRLTGGPGDDTIHIDRSGDVTVAGGPGNDVLIGGRDREKLWGGPGNDRINGRAGHDDYSGGPGRDELDSRDGSWTFGNAGGENVDCGSGRDAVHLADAGDDPQYTCERTKVKDTTPAAAGRLVPLGGKRLTTTAAVRPPGLQVQVRCVGGPCSGTAYLLEPKRDLQFAVVPRTGVDLQPGQTGTVSLPFGTGWGGFHRKGGRFRARLATLSGDAEGRTRTTYKKITVVGRRGTQR